jgi:hypothetical protein
MSMRPTISYLIIMSTLALASCVTPDGATNPRERYLNVLVHEMHAQSNTNWVRIHAADALNDHGRGDLVIQAFAPQVSTTTPQYRIGVWRTMARAAGGDATRKAHVERIRAAMLDVNGPDRVHAVETIAKLGAGERADRPALLQWLGTVDEATAGFIRWVLVLSSNAAERAEDEAKLAGLLDSADPIARLRAGFALGRIEGIAPASVEHLNRRLAIEPPESPARAYLLSAAFQHAPESSAGFAALKAQILDVMQRGKPNEQLEAAAALGRRGTAADLPVLNELLKHKEPDARIGGALGALNIISK